MGAACKVLAVWESSWPPLISWPRVDIDDVGDNYRLLNRCAMWRLARLRTVPTDLLCPSPSSSRSRSCTRNRCGAKDAGKNGRDSRPRHATNVFMPMLALHVITAASSRYRIGQIFFCL
jgi:hypothetical protein